jgi:hypothetical protein
MASEQQASGQHEAAARPEQQVKKSTEQFKRAGGFDLLEAVIDEVQNLNPDRQARKDIFLNEGSKKGDRQALLKRLKVWEGALEDEVDSVGIVSESEENLEVTNSVLKSNLKNALEQTRELEQSYRSVALFFKNSESDKVKNVSLMNADMDQLTDLDFPRFIDEVSDELKSNYDRLDLRENYSLLVIPGYLGSNKVIEKWAKIAHENKVMLVTDFGNFDTPDDVMEMFEAANLTGGDKYRSNVIMTCNWIMGRDNEKEVGEEEALFVPASAAYAGKIYGTLMSQVAAGKKFGSINEVDTVRFPLKKSEIANIEKLGLVPMVSEYGKVMAFSAKTLFDGDNLGLQTYSVVRVFDFVTKVLMDFLNRRAFENFNSRTKKNLLKQIVRFLDSITGPDKLIENFDIRRFEQDPNQKDHINLDIHLRPFFPAKNFLIKMDGQKGEDGNDWEAEYEQD